MSVERYFSVAIGFTFNSIAIEKLFIFQASEADCCGAVSAKRQLRVNPRRPRPSAGLARTVRVVRDCASTSPAAAQRVSLPAAG
jgi:hypothetical protein